MSPWTIAALRHDSALFQIQWTRLAVVVDRDEREDRAGNLVRFFAVAAAPPGFHRDTQRGSAGFLQAREEADLVADKNRADEFHRIHGNSGAAPTRQPRCETSRGEIHLPHQPAAENISGRIGIGGHRNRSYDGFSLGGRHLYFTIQRDGLSRH